jgi:predicted nucleic acid-binding protein
MGASAAIPKKDGDRALLAHDDQEDNANPPLRRSGRHMARKGESTADGIGRTPSPLDAQIAATAKAHDLVLVTFNRTHFEAFRGLAIEDWRS